MKYWLDTEFIEDGNTIDLISIGIVSEDGREFYAENLDCDLSKASPWVLENVIPKLIRTTHPELVSLFSWQFRIDRTLLSSAAGNTIVDSWTKPTGNGGVISSQRIAKSSALFCDPEVYGKPEFWVYYADYDWVVFCQLFGTTMDLPKGFPMYCRDIKQECDRLGNPRLPDNGKGEHNALEYARWNRTAWEFLIDYERKNEGV